MLPAAALMVVLPTTTTSHLVSSSLYWMIDPLVETMLRSPEDMRKPLKRTASPAESTNPPWPLGFRPPLPLPLIVSVPVPLAEKSPKLTMP